MTAAQERRTHTPEPPPIGPGVSPEFLRLLIAGRWVVLATILLALTLEVHFPVNHEGLIAIAIAGGLYNLAQTILLRGGRLRGFPPAVLIGVDLVFVTLVDWFSGGVRSPFIGVYHILIIVAAAFGDLRGSLTAAVAASLLESILVIFRPSGVPRGLRADYVLTTFPFLFLTALASGYLVRRLREQWERRQEAESALEAVQREVEIAREVQATFLHTPPPRVPGLAIATYSHPLYGIGGDMQDYVPLSDGIGVAVADVAGHSLAAALLAARLAHLLEELGLGTPLPDVLRSWNHAIYERTPPEVFATAVVLEVRTDTSAINYAVAGHPPPLLYRQADQRVHPLPCGGLALGVVPDAHFEVCHIETVPGDVLLLYTDGAIEARDAAGETLGSEGLARLLAQHASLPVSDLVARLGAEVAAGRQIQDDVTLVAIAREAVPGG